MVKAEDAARYVISLDTEKKYFTKKIIKLNGIDLYEGNARLNKILHLAQNIYIGQTGGKLIDADFYAYENGGVIPEVQGNYAFLLGTNDRIPFQVDGAVKTFLYKVFLMLKDAPINELVEIDHEDPAWNDTHGRKNQRMDSLAYAEEYKDRYEAANFYIDRMVV